MTLLVQITDTHIQPQGELLYGQVDTSVHLREIVSEINRFRPIPDLLVVTGDLVEKPCLESYAHFRELIAPHQDSGVRVARQPRRPGNDGRGV